MATIFENRSKRIIDVKNPMELLHAVVIEGVLYGIQKLRKNLDGVSICEMENSSVLEFDGYFVLIAHPQKEETLLEDDAKKTGEQQDDSSIKFDRNI